jgi:hypothetical protein
VSVWPVIAEGTYAEDLHLAWHRSQLPFDHLDDAGALPDSVAHSEVLHNFAKPPIHGWAFGHLRRLLPRALTLDELEQAYQRLARWTVFWLDHRRVPGHDLPHYQHGNDSGWDNATTFDGERLLETAGCTGPADDISHRFRYLCEKSGFAENFDARTGAGLRDRAYAWTADGYLVLGAAYEARRQPGGREPGDRQPCPAREELRKGLSECLHHRRRCEGASPLSGAVSALVRTKTVCPVRGRRGNGP